MKVDMVMPQMGESITEATISKWLKGPGEAVEKDEVILEISTDKVDSEIPAPASGVIAELLFESGAVVPVKAVIARIDTEGSAATAASPAKSASASSNGTANGKAVQAANPEAIEDDHAEFDSSGGRYYSPLVKSLAEKHGVSKSELDALAGSGQGGRVGKTDLMNYIEQRGAAKSEPAPQRSAPAAATPAAASKSTPAARAPLEINSDEISVVPMDNMRQAIAEHMVRSKQTSPHVYSIQEVDVSRIAKYRQMHKKKFEESEGFNLSFTPFFLEAAVKALVKFPHVNASVDGKRILVKKHVNLGCAVALGNSGLIVPVIKRSEEKNFVGLARSLNDLAARARSKKLSPDDVTGGTFTVTNPGVFGTMIGTPIINQPQAAILCLGAIKKRPVVVDDMIAIREICYLTLSYDHRIIDGSLGGQFLAFIREYLENWDLERPLY